MKLRIAVFAFLCGTSGATLAAQTSDFEFRVGGLGLMSTRNAVFESAVGTSSAIVGGGEGDLWWRNVGIGVRVFGGDFAADSGTQAVGKVANGDLAVQVGIRELSAEVGYGLRALTGAFRTTRWSFIKVGARSSIPLGASGFRGTMSFGVYTGVSQAEGTGDGSGKVFETGIVYAPRRAPVYLRVGYRFEQFTANTASEVRPEEIAGIVVAGGVRIGG